MAVAEASANVLFEAAKDRRLAEIYAPCFTLILQLRASDEYGEVEVLRRRIRDLLDRTEREAMRAGTSNEAIREVRFALVAFMDETIMSSNWSRKEYWVAKPLQLEFGDRYDAGEEFFVKLNELLKQPNANPDVLEVYYLCMTLGFKGRYQVYEQERFHSLVEETYQALSRVPGMGAGLIAPHGKPRDQVATEVRSKIPAWVVAVCAAAIAVLIWIGMSVYLSSTANSTAEEIRQVPRPQAVQ